MRYFLSIFLVMPMLAVIGCRSTISTTPEDYIGEYVLTPSSIVPGEFASFVILKRDHVVVEIRFSRECVDTHYLSPQRP